MRISGSPPDIRRGGVSRAGHSGIERPDPYEIDTLLQGGQGGLQLLVSCLPGGGDHATTSLVKWLVEGVDADFTNTAVLDPSGKTLGPFTVGATVKVVTEVSNSAGTRTSAIRTIVIQEPI